MTKTEEAVAITTALNSTPTEPVQAIRDFLFALDRGYFGSIAELKDSAFTDHLRAVAAKTE